MGRSLATGWIWSRTVLLLALALVAVTMPAVVAADETGSGEGEMSRNLLFIHHSCGGQLLADPGRQVGGERGSGRRCIYDHHPNGGGLRRLIEKRGFQVNELSYESELGEDTDIHHWRAKFTRHLAELKRTRRQDEMLPQGQENSVIAFKSCYPNNDYVGEGKMPGDPDSPERTIANSKAAYIALLPVFEQNPEILFIAVTPPPRAEPKPVGFKQKLKGLFKGKPKDADWARQVNDWLVDSGEGWLADYPLPNVVVFDYYDVLTNHGASNWSEYPTGGGRDSHPSGEGNSLAAQEFMKVLDKGLAAMGRDF
ncbi:hypothetical protein CSB20_03185 [bacterium DOLZORAL124_64_63]|nr:MAG: hypothetical protein CSB20_03185 [bacterium DOLZORAL124_64_63]